MKIAYVMVLLSVSLFAWGEEFTGTVDAIKFLAGDKIVINGSEYLVNSETEVYVGDIEVGPYLIEPGFEVSYSLSYQNKGLPFISRMELMVSKEKAAQMLNH